MDNRKDRIQQNLIKRIGSMGTATHWYSESENLHYFLFDFLACGNDEDLCRELVHMRDTVEKYFSVRYSATYMGMNEYRCSLH